VRVRSQLYRSALPVLCGQFFQAPSGPRRLGPSNANVQRRLLSLRSSEDNSGTQESTSQKCSCQPLAHVSVSLQLQISVQLGLWDKDHKLERTMYVPAVMLIISSSPATYEKKHISGVTSMCEYVIVPALYIQ